MENENLDLILKNQSIQVILNRHAYFQGDLRFSGIARIEGRYEGKIEAEEGILIIDSTAFVQADLKVDSLILFGKLEGEIEARSSVLMESEARFKGQVSSPNLSVKEGAIFEGLSLRVKPEF